MLTHSGEHLPNKQSNHPNFLSPNKKDWLFGHTWKKLSFQQRFNVSEYLVHVIAIPTLWFTLANIRMLPLIFPFALKLFIFHKFDPNSSIHFIHVCPLYKISLISIFSPHVHPSYQIPSTFFSSIWNKFALYYPLLSLLINCHPFTYSMLHRYCIHS